MKSQGPTKGSFLFKVCGFEKDFDLQYFKERHCYGVIFMCKIRMGRRISVLKCWRVEKKGWGVVLVRGTRGSW